MYDALMNYPLGRGDHLVRRRRAGSTGASSRSTSTSTPSVRDEDAATFAGRLERALTVYDPEVTAVQLNLLDSHDTPRFLSMVGGDTPSLRAGARSSR